MRRCCRTKAAASSMCRSSTTPTAISMPRARCSRDPNSVPGLSDGGAHCGIICDASFPTYLLTHWTRDRSRGEKLSIPFVVAAQSRKTALSVGLYDRGVIAPGFKADVNVIDYDRLHLHPPKVHYDLPVGGRRLLQQVDGYDATIVSGVVTQRGGKATGARPANWCAARRAMRSSSAWRRGSAIRRPGEGRDPYAAACRRCAGASCLRNDRVGGMGPGLRRDDPCCCASDPPLTQTSAAAPPPPAARARFRPQQQQPEQSRSDHDHRVDGKAGHIAVDRRRRALDHAAHHERRRIPASVKTAP